MDLKLYEVALRKEYRFEWRGSLDLEDVWTLNVNQLNEIYKSLTKEKKESVGESLFDDSKGNEDLENKIEIIKHIFTVKTEEANQAKLTLQKKARKEKLLGALANQEENALANMSKEDILAELAEL